MSNFKRRRSAVVNFSVAGNFRYLLSTENMAHSKTKPGTAELGRRIREIREAKGLSQSQLATAAGITTANLSLLEHGRSGSRGPTLDRLERLALALGEPLAAFFPSPELDRV